MPHTIEKTAYYFDELSDRAKERARQWYREGGFDYDWWDFVYEDAVRVAEILGISINTPTRRCVNTSTGREWTRVETAIYFSGFSSQGDGACFEGSYEFKADAREKIREYAPTDSELHRIADELHDLQTGLPSTVSATVKHRGHYSHSRCTEIDVTNDDPDADEGNTYPKIETQEAVTELLRAFMNWIYRQLETEYEWMTADAQVDDTIRANEYEFEADGSRLI